MTEWTPKIVDFLAILVGIALTHLLFLYTQFYRESRGYMWRAAGEIWGYLLVFLMLEWILGGFVFLLASRALNFYSHLHPILAAIVGVLVATAPIVLEASLLPKNRMTVRKLQSRLVKSILKVNLTLRYNFAWAIESSRQQDVYDSQTPNGWGLNLTPTEIGRRLRILYEIYKCDIAKQRQDRSLLYFHDKGTPWAMFYILVRYLGRKGLHQALKDSPASLSKDWDGRERRRIMGTRSQRIYSDSSKCRSYDDPNKQKDEGPAINRVLDSARMGYTDQERQTYRALAATWPVGPTILQVLNEAPQKVVDLQTLLPRDDVKTALSILEAANLIKARLDQIDNPEQGRRLYRALKSIVPGPTILHIVAAQREWTNSSKYFLPSEGLSTVLFSSLERGSLIEFTDFYFELSDIGESLIKKLPALGPEQLNPDKWTLKK